MTDRAVLARLHLPPAAVDEVAAGAPWAADLQPILDRLDEARPRHLDDEVFWDTMTDVGVLVARHHRERGVYGLADGWWLELHLRGDLVKLGALQFERRTDGAWGVHIPEGGPLDPGSCDDSFDRAAERLGATRFRCSSWLLDDQLADYLPPTSNIVRFQRRFAPSDERPGDEDVLKFVFGRVGTTSIDGLPRRTALERAVLDHLEAGRHWRVVTGSFER